MKNKINQILIEMTDAMGFHHCEKHYKAFNKAEDTLVECFELVMRSQQMSNEIEKSKVH